MIVDLSRRDVLHFKCDTQDELCRAFIRLQEFYESPYPDIRGNHFTVEQFAERYTATHGQPFSYYTDWNGFNVPGDVVREFRKLFRVDETPAEHFIGTMVAQTPGRVYVIGTHQECDITHELAHAYYYADLAYRLKVNTLLGRFIREYPYADSLVRNWLVAEGYTEAVLDDEVNAYLSTGGDPKMAADLGEHTMQHILDAGEEFATLFNKMMKGKNNAVRETV